MLPRLRQKYESEVVPALRARRGYHNAMQVPRIRKIVVNMGIGSGVDGDAIKAIANDLARITGQRPLLTRARKSIANFKVRKGMVIGAKVTLRGRRMYDFLDRLINVALPRIRDFRGISTKSFDGSGNYTLGIAEQTIFPEIDPDHMARVQGMDITIVTTARRNDEACELLSLLGMPFAGRGK